MVYSCNITYSKNLAAAVSHCHLSYSTKKSFLLFVEVHRVERKPISPSSGIRVLWQQGKRALHMPSPSCWEPPHSSESSRNAKARPSRISTMKKQTPGIFPAEWHLFRVWMTARYHSIITKNPLKQNWLRHTQQILWLFRALSVSDWSHLALRFNLFRGNEEQLRTPQVMATTLQDGV